MRRFYYVMMQGTSKGGWYGMVYRKSHSACRLLGCNKYRAYIKIRGKWTAVGYFNTKCKRFNYEPDSRAKELMVRVNNDSDLIDTLKLTNNYLGNMRKGTIGADDEETDETLYKNFGVSVD